MKRMLVLFTGLLTACQVAKVEPVDIDAGDMCSFCRMAISEKRFAAEFRNNETTVFKFDDTGCMLNYINERIQRQDILASYVMDYEAGRWLNAKDAYYVRSSQIKTPMGGGTIAFADKSRADLAASQFQGRVLKFDELF